MPRLHPLFLLIVAAGLVLGQGAAVIAYVLSLALHEACHVAMARSLGLEIGRIEVLPFGGRAQILGLEAHGPMTEGAIALAGPLGNVVVLALAAALMRVGGVDPDRLRLVLDANLALVGVNILPAFPLDGGRMLRAILWRRLGFSDATRAALHIGRVVAWLLVPVGALLQLAGYPGWQLTLLGAVVLIAANAESRDASLKRYALWLNAIEDLKSGRMLPVQVLAAGSGVRLRQVLRRLFGRSAHEVILYDRDLGPIARLYDRDLYRAFENGDLDKRLEEIARPRDQG